MSSSTRGCSRLQELPKHSQSSLETLHNKYCLFSTESVAEFPTNHAQVVITCIFYTANPHTGPPLQPTLPAYLMHIYPVM